MDHDLRQALDELEKRVAERIDRAESNLRSEFHGWARTYEIRARGASAAIHNLDERLGLIEERVGRLERASINPRVWEQIEKHERGRNGRQKN
jgi:hypothetical protein